MDTTKMDAKLVAELAQDKERVCPVIDLHNHPELAQDEGMVYQVWQDGEITLQKSGSLLWQRAVHCIEYGSEFHAVPSEWFPYQSGNNGYIFTDKTGAEAVRAAIFRSA